MEHWWTERPINVDLLDRDGRTRWFEVPPFLWGRRLGNQESYVDAVEIATLTQRVLGFEPHDAGPLSHEFWLYVVPAIEHAREEMFPTKLDELLRPSLRLITLQNALLIADQFRVGKRKFPRGFSPLQVPGFVRVQVSAKLQQRIIELTNVRRQAAVNPAPIRSSGGPKHAA